MLARQGGQSPLQKLITNVLPASEARLTVPPSVEARAKLGALPPAGCGDCSGPAMVSSACNTSGAPQPSPPEASWRRPCALSALTSAGGMSPPTLGAPRYTSLM